MNFKDLKQLCPSHGFTNVVPLACDTIELKPEVRQMCASDSCHKYNKCWSCPPGCGTLEECEQRVRKYKLGILVQTVDSWRFHGWGRYDAHRSYAQPPFTAWKKICGNFTRICFQWARLLHKKCKIPVPVRTLPAAFSRTRPFPLWKPMECWSCRFVVQTTLTIIMVLERLRIPAVIY